MADFILGRLKFTFLGAWDDTTEYIVDDIVVYNGTGWVCKTNHTSTASFPDDRDDGYWEAITTGLNFRGEWSSLETYQKNDIVQYTGTTWIAVTNNVQGTTPNPSLSTPWNLFLQGDADSVMTTEGDISYRGASAAQRLAIGVDGAVLQSDGDVPTWSRTINNADDVILTGQVYGGTGAPAAETSLGLTNIQALFKGDVNDFSQFAIHNANNGGDASTDFIAYADNGDNDSGWIDMGVTSSAFTAAAFGLTEANDGYIFFSSPASAPTAKGNLVIATDSNGVDNDIVFATGGFATGQEKMRLTDQDHDGFNKGLNLMDDISTTNGAFYVGPDAKTLIDDAPGYAGLTHVTGLFVDDVDDFVQFAIKNNNTGTSASTDLIAYASNGDNDSGWIDIGITSETFNNPSFSVTGPNTGYLFMSAPDADGLVTTISGGTLNNSATTITVADTTGFPTSGTLVIAGGEQVTYSGKTSTTFTGCTRGANSSTPASHADGTRVYKLSSASYTGDLLIGTGTGGSHNDIVIFSGGFDAGNERIRVIGNTRAGHAEGVEILAATESTSTTTGALRVNGGVGLIGNMNIGGNINIAGTITVSGGGSSVSTTTLTVSDPMIVMGSGNTSTDTVDLGFYGIYGSSGTKYTGLVRDATDSTYKLFSGVTSAPTTTVDFTSATYAPFKAGSLELTATTASSSTSTGALIVPGGVGVGGKLYVGNDQVNSGDIAVNGGDITTTATTFNLVNSTATTVNIAGAGTAIAIGASTGTTTINNALTVTKQTTLAQISEILNTKTSATGTVTHDYSTGDIWFHSSISANFTVNLTNVPTTNDRAISIVLVLNQGATGYIPSAFQIDGVSQTLRWANNTTPTASTSKIDIVSFTLFRTGSTWYVVGQLTAFA